jgi:hypothetical protein
MTNVHSPLQLPCGLVLRVSALRELIAPVLDPRLARNQRTLTALSEVDVRTRTPR